MDLETFNYILTNSLKIGPWSPYKNFLAVLNVYVICIPDERFLMKSKQNEYSRGYIV